MGKFIGIHDEKTGIKGFVNTDKIISFHVTEHVNKDQVEFPYKLVIRYGVEGDLQGEVNGTQHFLFKEEKTANDVATNILLKHGDL